MTSRWPIARFLGEASRMAVPAPEHYLPLLAALALQEPGETAEFSDSRGVSAISMASVLIGGPAQELTSVTGVLFTSGGRS